MENSILVTHTYFAHINVKCKLLFRIPLQFYQITLKKPYSGFSMLKDERDVKKRKSMKINFSHL